MEVFQESPVRMTIFDVRIIDLLTRVRISIHTIQSGEIR